MHWKVPIRPERGHVFRIPPVVVEITVREFEYFAHGVEERVKNHIKPDEPHQVVRNLQGYQEH